VTLVHGLGAGAHQAPGIVWLDQEWRTYEEPGPEPSPDTEILQLQSEIDGTWTAPQLRCSCGVRGCPQMTGTTVFLPKKVPCESAPISTPPPATVEEPEDDDAEVGVDELQQLAELRDQIARLQRNGDDPE
jgi:hypothetical protein